MCRVLKPIKISLMQNNRNRVRKKSLFCGEEKRAQKDRFSGSGI